MRGSRVAGVLVLLATVSACGQGAVNAQIPVPTPSSPPPPSLSASVSAPSSPVPRPAMTVGPDVPGKKTKGCPVTGLRSRGDMPRDVDEQFRQEQLSPGDWYGVGGLWTLLDTTDLAYKRSGGMVTVKTVWWRDHDERLTVEAVSVKTGETVRGESPGPYPVPGAQPISLPLPHLGCWHVTASLGGTKVRFITDVARIAAPD
ncbi:hypothetical protein ACFQ08_07600 [Streptosporangium algeriense]|uniref:DUF4871 domain-containing protein n=1 Tax=Streptosporangium algeriense TaxID=1682748 RepID=A0ABW3DN42_9ACTN